MRHTWGLQYIPYRFGSYAYTSLALLRLPLNASFGLCRSAIESAVIILVLSYWIALGYVLRASDQRARASVRVQAIGVFVSYVTATV